MWMDGCHEKKSQRCVIVVPYIHPSNARQVENGRGRHFSKYFSFFIENPKNVGVSDEK